MEGWFCCRKRLGGKVDGRKLQCGFQFTRFGSLNRVARLFVFLVQPQSPALATLFFAEACERSGDA